ncbi:MAG: hypothetical protein K9L24_05030 [Spirochaetia bacterium]|nr:hypothetical protein [Spirochaetia bacterium]MCF7952842.1 hypothetical protein [Spirochaetales bacterium]
MVSLGIDIGTTNVSVTALDLDTGEILESYSRPNKRLASDDEYAYLQDPHVIEESVRLLLSKIKTPCRSAAVTGQVHGILYYDSNGSAISPLYTWLDRRAAEVIDGESPQDRLKRITGTTMPPGYGLLTHYTNSLINEVPNEAVGMTGILEYITGRLIGKTLDKADSSCISLFGAYDSVGLQNDQKVLQEVFSKRSLKFPGTAEPFEKAGDFAEHIGEGLRQVPFAYPVGDNQAGFFGLVSKPETSCLISIGTSGQISLFSPSTECPVSMELRPFFGQGYLHVGASLSAGKSYEVLKDFIKSIYEQAAGSEVADEKVFDLMKDSAHELDLKEAASLKVTTKFNGTRREPDVRGAIENISFNNLKLGNLVQGTVDGIIRELHDYTYDLGSLFSPVQQIIAAGSSVRKNELFSEALEKQFGLQTIIADIDDGAAMGAALIGAVSAELIDVETAQSLVEKIVGTA